MEHRHIPFGSRAYWRANLGLFLAGFVTFSVLHAFQPLLPLLSGEFNISPTASSLPLSAATFALALALPLAGSVSDAVGRRGLMIGALTLSSALTLVTAATDSAGGLIAVRLLQGIALAGVPAVAMAYLGEEMEPRAVTATMGLYIAGNAMGGMSGRVVTGWLTASLGWRGALGLLGCVSLLQSVGFLLLMPPSRNFQRKHLQLTSVGQRLGQHLGDPGLRYLYLIAFAAMGAFVTFYNYLMFRLLAPPFALSQAQASTIFLCYLLGALSSSVLGSLAQRVGAAGVLRLSLAAMAGGLLLGVGTTLPAAIAGCGLFTVGFFGTHTLASAWVGRRAQTNRGAAAALYLFAYYLGASACGTGGGIFWSNFGWPGVTGFILLLVAVAALATQRLLRLSEPQQRAQPATLPTPSGSGA